MPAGVTGALVLWRWERALGGSQVHPALYLDVKSGLIRNESAVYLLHAFPLILVSISEVIDYGDNTSWSQHLKLEVGIVGDHQELGVARPPKDGMVSPSKSTTSKESISFR